MIPKSNRNKKQKIITKIKYFAQSKIYESPDPSTIPLPNFDEDNFIEISKTDLLKQFLKIK